MLPPFSLGVSSLPGLGGGGKKIKRDHGYEPHPFLLHIVSQTLDLITIKLFVGYSPSQMFEEFPNPTRSVVLVLMSSRWPLWKKLIEIAKENKTPKQENVIFFAFCCQKPNQQHDV